MKQVQIDIGNKRDEVKAIIIIFKKFLFVKK